MIFSKPTKHQVTKTGYSDSYHLDANDITLTVETVAGGWRAFSPIDEDSLIYILQGIGKAKLKETKEFDINGEALIEIPSHSFFKLEEGQYRYIYARGVTNYSIETNKEITEFNASENQRLVYVLDGIGSATIDDNNYVLKEGYVMEIPKNTDVSLKGNFQYLYIQN